MDYATLYEAWRKEKESEELQRLDKGFYAELGEHIRANRDEFQMLDEKTLRAKLATEENSKIERLFKDLMWTRYRKILEATCEGKHIPTDFLASEEEHVYRDVSSALEKMKSMEKDVLRGRVPKFREAKAVEKPERILVRFLQSIPAIVGPNAKVYGPFKAEDVASLPVDNAESLIRHGIAVKVEIE